ncbi:MAG: hypothetical protein ACOC25_07170, partial [Alkalispirochaetaceae bacterium]
MNQRNELLLHLIGELGHFVLDSNPGRMVVNLHLEDDGCHLTVLDDVERSDEQIEELNNAVKATQRPELAGYYGSMAGLEMLGSARLSLVGLQVKGARIKKREGGTTIDLWLGDDRFDASKFTIP